MNRRRSMLAIVAGLLLLGVAAEVGFWAGRQSSERELTIDRELRVQREMLANLSKTVSVIAQRSATYCSAMGGESRMDPAVLEAVVRKGLEQQQEQTRAENEVLAQPSIESLEAFAQSQQQIHTAIQTRRWTEEDRRALRAGMGRLTGEQHAELLRQLSVAINEGRLTIQTDGPPF